MRLLFVLFSLLLCCAPAYGEVFYLGGIQVNEPNHEKWVDTLREEGMNTVAVTVYAHHGDWDSANLWFDETAESVISEIKTAKSRGLHVVLILRVALDHAFERNLFYWHGMIMPKSEQQIAEWFRRYSRFVLSWARRAQTLGVDMLGVASEMNSLTSTRVLAEVPALEEYYLNDKKQERRKQRILSFASDIEKAYLPSRSRGKFSSLRDYIEAESRHNRDWAGEVSKGKTAEEQLTNINRRRQLLDWYWRKLIDEVRTVYQGKLTYAANFDQYHEVGFWDALDVIGINAYFPLREELVDGSENSELLPLLRESWQSEFGKIRKFLEKNSIADKKIVFTELGYTFRRNSTFGPWAKDGFKLVGEPPNTKLLIWAKQPIDYRERQLAVRALREVTENQYSGMLQGLLYWKLSTKPEHREIEPFVHIIGDDKDQAFRQELVGLLVGAKNKH